MKICCFTGSRKLPFQNEADPRYQKFIQSLTAEIMKAIDNGYTYFISGMALGVDSIAACIIIRIQKERPELNIQLEAAIPCKDQDKFWTDEQKKEYRFLCDSANKRTLVSEHYTRFCMQKRNAYMVDKASLIIAVPASETGGTVNTINYAKSKGKKVIIVFP